MNMTHEKTYRYLIVDKNRSIKYNSWKLIESTEFYANRHLVIRRS